MQLRSEGGYRGAEDRSRNDVRWEMDAEGDAREADSDRYEHEQRSTSAPEYVLADRRVRRGRPYENERHENGEREAPGGVAARKREVGRRVEDERLRVREAHARPRPREQALEKENEHRRGAEHGSEGHRETARALRCDERHHGQRSPPAADRAENGHRHKPSARERVVNETEDADVELDHDFRLSGQSSPPGPADPPLPPGPFH